MILSWQKKKKAIESTFAGRGCADSHVYTFLIDNARRRDRSGEGEGYPSSRQKRAERDVTAATYLCAIVQVDSFFVLFFHDER